MQKQTLIINDAELTRILGRRGSKLNEYREIYGTKIKVGRSVPHSNLIPIEIERFTGGDGSEIGCKQAIIAFLNTYTDHYTGNRDGVEPKSRGFEQEEVPSPTLEGDLKSVDDVNTDVETISHTNQGGFQEPTDFSNPWGDQKQEPYKSAPEIKNGSDVWGSGDKWPGEDDHKAETNRRERTGDFQTMLQEFRKSKIARSDMPPLLKDVYQEHAEISRMSEAEVERTRKKKNEVQVEDLSGNDRYPPRIVKKFEHILDSYPELLAEVRRYGFDDPTPIQCQMWPILFSGFDCIGIAQTGSGKTIAFLFPAFIHIIQQTIPRKDRTGPTVLVLSPTRELAQQIDKEVQKYSYKNVKSVCIYGGGSRMSQVSAVSVGVDIVIATPGRLNDLICDGDLSLDFISYVVLDEADRMLDMGFEPQIRDVLGMIRSDRHTVMTSATWPPQVQRLAVKYMNDPFLVSIGSLDLKACANVTQEILVIQRTEKDAMLNSILDKRQKDDKFLIFCSMKVHVDSVSAYLSGQGHENRKMHGDMMQSDRERSLATFKKGTVRILVASDVASRGIDVNDITHVINYDYARNSEDYVHRIGRTARAGKTGTAVTFFTIDDKLKAKELIQVLTRVNQVVPDALRSLAHNFGEECAEAHDIQERFKAPAACAHSPPRGRRGERAPRGQVYHPSTGMKVGSP